MIFKKEKFVIARSHHGKAIALRAIGTAPARNLDAFKNEIEAKMAQN